MSKNAKIEKTYCKKMETHGNKSKIGKGGQDCMTTILEDIKQAGVVIWVGKVRLEKTI